ncbi:MAG: hypothetical protein DRQ78_00140 [Epsilonproteobacteria bacterium]|nr:MAG: hypothetical protein DRQ78_00140 [Campylobacterota bacterium]
MKTNIYMEPISDRKKKRFGITKDHINTELMSDAYPALYIETDHELIISNGLLTSDDLEIALPGLTMLDIVNQLREYGITAYITRKSVGMLPAELLIDFKNKIVISEEIDLSPKRLSEINHKNMLHTPGLDDANIKREIVTMYSNERDIKYKKDKGTYSYMVEDGNLYTNGLLPDTMAVVKYDINKFFLYTKDENIIELGKMLKNKSNTISKRIMINNVNARNWDKV